MSNRIKRRCAAAAAGLAAALLAWLAPTAPALAAGGLANLQPVAPAMNCADLTVMDFRNVTDARVRITSAVVNTTVAAQPVCVVTGTIAPANTVVMRLPLTGWTQRYVQTGCGGLCGSSNIGYGQSIGCPIIADGSVASATTDMGHQGNGTPSGSWATSPQAAIDFAYRGMHVTAQVAKHVITRFYGQRPVYSYFSGCSDGGREALMEAQRYPDDFDGIAAGAPANNLVVQNTYHHGWNAVTNQDANGQYILLASKLPMLHTAVLNACDAIDGLVDGLIDDPRLCHFDPATIQCTVNQDPATCLTAAEVGVVRRLHDGATDANGNRLEPKIAHHWGSELLWSLFVPTTTAGPSGSINFVLPFLRYLTYFNLGNPALTLADLPFTVPGFWQANQTAIYQSAMDPNLGPFQRRGGKLLLWHGLNDQHIPPQNTLQYWQAMRDQMGAANVEQFVKLYLFPGVGHCSGGEGPNTFDVLTPVMAWVEGGVTPNQITASLIASNVTTRSRPVFPFPVVARYAGSGSIDDASNFVPFLPATGTTPPVGAEYDWVGKSLFSTGYQAQCQAVGTQLVCNPSGLPFSTR